MIELDKAALHARFLTEFDPADPQVSWMGKPTGKPDESKPYAYMIVEPGHRFRYELGVRPGWEQHGVITFSVTFPKGTGDAAAYRMQKRFDDLFRDWVSADQALVMGPSRGDISEADKSYTITLRFDWKSQRKE